MHHKSTIIEFESSNDIWKVVYTPGEWGRPAAAVYKNSILIHDFKDAYNRSAAVNPTKTQAASIISQARKIIKENGSKEL